jgi:hypothetical protein
MLLEWIMIYMSAKKYKVNIYRIMNYYICLKRIPFLYSRYVNGRGITVGMRRSGIIVREMV